MITVECLGKIRDVNDNIIGYYLRDKQGNIRKVKPEALKLAIKQNEVEVTNLKLTSDNRLIDSITRDKRAYSDASEFLNKAQLLGFEITELKLLSGKSCYLVNKTPQVSILVIPDNITKLPDPLGLDYEVCTKRFFSAIRSARGTLKIVGGKGLKNTNSMFCECVLDVLDVSDLNTSSITAMNSMFAFCRIKKIIGLNSFDTTNVTNMCGMFSGCKTDVLDLSSFITDNVTTMSGMFWGCSAEFINLASFNTHKVENMGRMFSECKTRLLDLSSFDTSNVRIMNAMFFKCKTTDVLDLSAFDTRKVRHMWQMFRCCKTPKIDISKMSSINVEDMENMFYGCKAEVEATDIKILKELRERG